MLSIPRYTKIFFSALTINFALEFQSKKNNISLMVVFGYLIELYIIKLNVLTYISEVMFVSVWLCLSFSNANYFTFKQLSKKVKTKHQM